MNPYLSGLLSLTPLAAVMLLLVILRWPAKRAMAVAYVLVSAVALVVWQVPVLQVLAASLQGLIQAGSILWIVFGALLLLSMLRESGAVESIRRGFMHVSPDPRVQALIVGFLFGAFLEGVSGFGTPAAILSPLLVTLGFPAAAAVMVAMLNQSAPVTFGAIGTPVIVGMGTGLQNEQVIAHAAAMGFPTWEAYLHHVSSGAAMLHMIVGPIIPLFLVALLGRIFSERKSYLDGLQAWPIALLAGVAFTVPYVLVARFLGPEFPTIIGSLVGLGVVVLAARWNVLMPRTPLRFPPHDAWDPNWIGTLAEPGTSGENRPTMRLLRAWIPYVVVAVLLVLTRLPQLGLQKMLTSVVLAWPAIFGTDISASFEPLYSPGFIFTVVALLVPLVHPVRPQQVPRAWKGAWQQIVKAAPTLLLAVPMVRVFIHSGGGAAGLPSMPIALAETASAIVGGAWPAVAPWVGALGSFVSGSNTFSEMMFSYFQWTAATRIGASPEIVVAAQSVGGAAGNMIAVHNVVAAAAVVGLVGREGLLIRRLLIPLCYYLAIGGAVAYTWQAGFGIHVGTAILALVGGITAWALLRDARRRASGG